MPGTNPTLNESLDIRNGKLKSIREILGQVREEGFDINKGVARNNLAGFREICDSEIEPLLNRKGIPTAFKLDNGQRKGLYDFVLEGKREFIDAKVSEQIDEKSNELDDPEATKELVSKLLGQMKSFYQENNLIFNDINFEKPPSLPKQQRPSQGIDDIDTVIPAADVLTRKAYEDYERESSPAVPMDIEAQWSSKCFPPISEEKLNKFLSELTEDDLLPCGTYAEKEPDTQEELAASQQGYSRMQGAYCEFFNDNDEHGPEAQAGDKASNKYGNEYGSGETPKY